MYIAGTDNDIEAGICTGGIAHAPRPRLQPATWFDGSDDYVETPIIIPLNGTITIAQWVYVQHLSTTLGHHQRINQKLYYHGVNNVLYFILISKSWAAIPLVPKVWHHSIVSWDGDATTIKLWHNGMLTAGTIVTSNISADYVQFSNNDARTRLEGVTRECYYWNRQVSDAEALAIYEGNPPTPTAYWKGNGNTDDAWRDQVGTNHGTVYGSPERCLLRGDGKVILNNIIQNP